MERPLRVLIVDDVVDDAERTMLALRRGGLDAAWERVETPDELRRALVSRTWDAVLSDYTLPAFERETSLEIVKTVDPDLPFLLVSGTVGEDVAVEMMRAGADDYVFKNNLARLAPAVRREVREAENRRARRSAERHAQQLAAIVSDADYAILSKKLDGVITTWNAGAERLYGYTAEEAVGRHFSFLIPAENANEWPIALRKIERGENVSAFETVRLQKSGRRIDLLTSFAPIRDAGGRVIGVSKIARDVSKQKQAERDRRLLFSIIEYSPDFIGIAHRSLQVLFVNRAGQAMVGLDGDERVRETFIPDYFNKTERDRVAAELLPVLDSGGHLTGEIAFRHFSNNNEIPTEWNAFAVPNPEGGTPTFFACIARDVSDKKRTRQEIRVSESRFRALVENSWDGVTLIDHEGIIRYTTSATTRVLGYSPDEFLGRNGLEFVHPDDRLETQTAFGYAAAEPGRSTICTYRYRHRDGSWLWIETAVTNLLADPDVRALILNSRDITASKTVAATLRESEERYRLLFEANPYPMWVYALKTLQFLAVNDIAVQHYGYTREEFLGMTIRDLQPTEDVPKLEAFIARQTTNSARSFLGRHRKKNGTLIDVEVSSNGFRDGEHAARLVLALDVTERRRAEAEVMRTANLLKAVADGTPDAVYVKDRAGRYLLFNAAAARFVGRPVEEVLGQDDTAIFAPESALLVMDQDRRVMESNSVLVEEDELTADGITRTYMATKAPYRDGSGNTIGLLGISRDISDRKRVEDALKEKEAKLAEAARMARMGYWSRDLGTGRLDWSEELFEIFGVNPKDFARTFESFLAILHPADRVGVRERIAQAEIETGKFDHVYRIVVGEKVRMIHEVGQVIASKEGKPDKVAGTAQDVTEQMRAEAAVRASEERYRTLVAATSAIVWHTPESGEFEAEQPGWTKFTGQTFDRLRGWGWLDAVHPEDRERTIRVWSAAVADRGVYEVEHRLRRRDGEYRLMTVRAVPIRNASGAIAEWVGVHADVTDQKRAEIERAELLGRLTLQIERMPLAYLLSGPDFRYARWNPSAERMFGYAEAEILGKHPFEVIVPPSSRDLVGGIFARLRAGDMNAHGSSENLTKDGRTIVCEWHNTPLFAPDGTFQGILSLAQDVTERRLGERALHLRDRAIGAATQGILITDPGQPDDPLVYVNPAFERLTGYASGEVLGRNCRFLQGKDTDRETVGRLREAIRIAQPCTVELLNYRKDGTPFWNELSISPVRNAAGHLTHFVGVQADVTSRRSLEEQFRQVQKMEAVGQLAGGVAHDFNNLLTVINGYSDLLLQELPKEDPSRELIAEIHKAGERSAGLTRQLLAFSRRQVLTPRILDLNEIVRNTEKMLRRLIGEDVRLATTLQAELWAVQADPGQIDQVLMNLAVNARDAMPRGGRLTIETRNVELDEVYVRAKAEANVGPHVLLSVTDSGVGIPPEIQAKIFEPFFTTKGQGKGTGLGLATVYGIVKQSGGHITVYSEVGVGTTFKIYLPRATENTGGTKIRLGMQAPPKGTETILLAEDEDGVRALTRHVLTACGYQVLEATDGDEAIRMATDYEGAIHLLITDVVMPGSGGRAVSEQVTEHHPGVRVLFVSGYTDDAVIRHGVLQEGVHFVQKPFSPNALAIKVREILDGTRRVDPL